VSSSADYQPSIERPAADRPKTASAFLFSGSEKQKSTKDTKATKDTKDEQ
jgi:hypothetical protein